MPDFEPGTVCVVPFPYVDRPVRKRRPCVVVGAPAPELDLVWVLMVTSRDNAPWPGDVEIDDLPAAGLPHASVVRTAKIATVEKSALQEIGSLSRPAWSKVIRSVGTNLPGIST
jgi:mRNA interferase MazF